jgi:ferredoxin
MRTTVVLCGDRTPDGEWVRAAGVDVHVVPGLCRKPGTLEGLSIEPDRLVVGACSGEYDLGPLQREFRRLGVDALGVQIVDLSSAGDDPDRLALMLAGAVARARAFPSSGPEQVKLSFPCVASRRSLLTFTLPEYHAAPSIDVSLCAASDGCQACVSTCPRGALSFADGTIIHDLAACEPCGICVTSCPTGAISNAAVTSTQLEAQISALLEPSIGPPGFRGIAFLCSRATEPVSQPGWFPVTVPCTGMVTPAWMLAPLMMRAGAVSVIPCSTSGCALANDEAVSRRIDYCGELLTELGLDPHRVRRAATGEIPEPLSRVPMADAFGPMGAVDVLSALSTISKRAGRSITHTASPVGLVAIDGQACTACGMCTRICPTGALVLEPDRDEISITFDPTLCVACGQCTSVCPERTRRAITAVATTDFDALTRGRSIVFRGGCTTCVSCGTMIAPSPMIDRLASLLGQGQAGTIQVLSRYCIDCRRRSVRL